MNETTGTKDVAVIEERDVDVGGAASFCASVGGPVVEGVEVPAVEVLEMMGVDEDSYVPAVLVHIGRDWGGVDEPVVWDSRSRRAAVMLARGRKAEDVVRLVGVSEGELAVLCSKKEFVGEVERQVMDGGAMSLVSQAAVAGVVQEALMNELAKRIEQGRFAGMESADILKELRQWGRESREIKRVADDGGSGVGGPSSVMINLTCKVEGMNGKQLSEMVTRQNRLLAMMDGEGGAGDNVVDVEVVSEIASEDDGAADRSEVELV